MASLLRCSDACGFCPSASITRTPVLGRSVGYGVRPVRRRPRVPRRSNAPARVVLSQAQHPPPAVLRSDEEASSEPTFTSRFGDRIPGWMLSRLTDMGFTHPTDVQLNALELALPPAPLEDVIETTGAGAPLGKDVVVHAQTGCGKTLAYLLPTIAAVDPGRACVQGLVVVPTQELGMQVYKTLRRLCVAWSHANVDSATDFPVLPMLNQADLRRQKLQLRRTAPRVIVGNPHRIAELVESGRLRLDLLRVLVVDEFDACLLDNDTTRALQVILGTRGRERRQTILASATVPQHRHFLRQCVREHWTEEDIEHVWVEESLGQQVPSTLKHCYALVDARKKLSALRAMLSMFGTQEDGAPVLPRAIVFVMSSRPVTDIVVALNSAFSVVSGTREITEKSFLPRQDPVVGLADDMSVLQRARAMRRFRSGKARVLVATDVAARGLDVENITHVFHVDAPSDSDAYLHRAGRAARLGRDGASVVLVAPGEDFVVRRFGNVLGVEFERVGRDGIVSESR